MNNIHPTTTDYEIIYYIVLLKETLETAESYQDWSDFGGKSRYKSSIKYSVLRSFENEHEDFLLKRGILRHTVR